MAEITIDNALDGDAGRTLAEDVREGLTRAHKELPPKHLYDTRGAELFEQICELPEYSEVFFGGDYRVLRGGSFATSALVATPTFRNWDHPARRQIFSGLRVAA